MTEQAKTQQEWLNPHQAEINALRDALEHLGPYQDDLGKIVRSQIALTIIQRSGIMPDRIDIDADFTRRLEEEERRRNHKKVISASWIAQMEAVFSAILGPLCPIKVIIEQVMKHDHLVLDIANRA